MKRISERHAEALGAYVKLMRAADSVTARAHRHLREHGLSVSQFGVLEALHHLGPLSQAELGRKILKTSGNITMVIDNLEKRGFVSRQRSPADRRQYRIRLTRDGEDLIGRIFPAQAEYISAELRRLSPAEQRELGRLCRKLGRGDETAPPGKERKG